MKSTITVENREFELVAIQRPFVSAVYRCENIFLRLAQPGELSRVLGFHEQLLASGAPVPKILSKGQYEDYSFFIEESLGDSHFGSLFAGDLKTGGEITEERFQNFLDIITQFARMQFRTMVPSRSFDGFAEGIQLSRLCAELPNVATRIRERFSAAIENLKPFPLVVTHGDFNPHNLYPRGIIDLESAFIGPFGFDLITNIVHVEYFPVSADYEFFQEYTFTEGEKQRYFAAIDGIAESFKLPPFSSYASDFEFCRAIWLAGGIPQYPKLQEFRYDLLQQRFLL